MNNLIKAIAAVAAAQMCAGCFTISRTPDPETVQVRTVKNAPALRLDGFHAEFLDWIPSYGWSNVYVPGGRRWGGHWQTVQNVTYLPKFEKTDAYLRTAVSVLEDAGFTVNGPNGEYAVTGEFSGPSDPDGTAWRRAAICGFSLLFCHYDAVSWRLDMRVREIATGRLVFKKTFEQEYECSAFSPLWLFGLASHAESDSRFADNWCLTNLSIEAAREVAEFFAARTEKGSVEK